MKMSKNLYKTSYPGFSLIHSEMFEDIFSGMNYNEYIKFVTPSIVKLFNYKDLMIEMKLIYDDDLYVAQQTFEWVDEDTYMTTPILFYFDEFYNYDAATIWLYEAIKFDNDGYTSHFLSLKHWFVCDFYLRCQQSD